MKNASRISIAALCAAAALGLAGCNSPSSGTAPEAAPVQVQAQDLTPMQKAAGVYAGELPCADCSGIRTTLYLRANGVYTRISEYVGRDTFEDGSDLCKRAVQHPYCNNGPPKRRRLLLFPG